MMINTSIWQHRVLEESEGGPNVELEEVEG